MGRALFEEGGGAFGLVARRAELAEEGGFEVEGGVEVEAGTTLDGFEAGGKRLGRDGDHGLGEGFAAREELRGGKDLVYQADAEGSGASTI